MIVDCHTHISCPQKPTDTAEHLRASEVVDACIVLSAGPNEYKQANAELADYIAKHPARMVGFAAVNPVDEKITEKSLNELLEKNYFSGVVLYNSTDDYHPAHSRAMRFYEMANERGLCIYYHNFLFGCKNGRMDFAQPVLIDEFAAAFPNIKFVVGSMGHPFVAQTLSLISKHSNVFGCLTVNPAKPWQVFNTVVSAYEANVLDKLLFGSGFPVGSAQSCIETLLGFNKLLGDNNILSVPREKIRAVVQRDSLSLLGLKTK